MSYAHVAAGAYFNLSVSTDTVELIKIKLN